MPDGNAEAVRVIADQLFDIWSERQGKQRASWPAWLGVVLSFATLIFAAGMLRGDIAVAADRSLKNERRIESLEDQRAAIARIEAKVDVLMEERSER